MLAWDRTNWLTGTVNRMTLEPGLVQPDLSKEMIVIGRDRTSWLTGTVNRMN